jgi:hypothetical protein
LSDRPSNAGLPERSLAFSTYLLAFCAPFSIAAAQPAAGLVILSGFACLVSGLKADSIPIWVRLVMPSFLAVVLVSSILSPDFSSALPTLKKIWVLLCLVPLAAYSFAYSRARLANFLILGTSVASILGLYRYMAGAVERAAPFSGGYTTLALFEAAVIPVAIGASAADRSFRRWLYMAAVPVMAAGLLFTGTRAGWIAAVVGIIIIGFFLSKKLTLAALIGGCLLLAAIPQSRNRIVDRFKSDKKGGITSGRVILYQAALGPVSNLPFWGYGPGSFNRIVPDEVLDRTGDKGIRSWHSTPLEILIESGPLAAVLLIVFFSLPFSGFRRYRSERGTVDLDGIATLSSLVVLYLAGFTTNLMRDFMVLSLLVIVWSMSFSRRAENEVTGNKSGQWLLTS